MSYQIPNWLIILGGCGQIFTALIYPYIRHQVFDWYNDIKQLKPLNQEIAKTYGRYIQGLNFYFGLIAILIPNDLKKKPYYISNCNYRFNSCILGWKGSNSNCLLPYV